MTKAPDVHHYACDVVPDPYGLRRYPCVAAASKMRVICRHALMRTPAECAMRLHHGKGVVSLVWELGSTMRLVGPLQTLLARPTPEASLCVGPADEFPHSTGEMRWRIEFLSVAGR